MTDYARPLMRIPSSMTLPLLAPPNTRAYTGIFVASLRAIALPIGRCSDTILEPEGLGKSEFGTPGGTCLADASGSLHITYSAGQLFTETL